MSLVAAELLIFSAWGDGMWDNFLIVEPILGLDDNGKKVLGKLMLLNKSNILSITHNDDSNVVEIMLAKDVKFFSNGSGKAHWLEIVKCIIHA